MSRNYFVISISVIVSSWISLLCKNFRVLSGRWRKNDDVVLPIFDPTSSNLCANPGAVLSRYFLRLDGFGWRCVETVAKAGAVFIAAQTPVSRCFHFTWLGPKYNNESVFLNATCQDATRLARGVPCVEPLVASYDGTWPDVDYIWRYHSAGASCILANNDVCAQFTYYFDGHVDNSTYLCTRAIDSNGEAITSGCYEQRNGSFVTRACFCRSVPGGVPCNNAVQSNLNLIFIIIFALAMIGNT